jgi:hypothetical protein
MEGSSSLEIEDGIQDGLGQEGHHFHFTGRGYFFPPCCFFACAYPFKLAWESAPLDEDGAEWSDLTAPDLALNYNKTQALRNVFVTVALGFIDGMEDDPPMRYECETYFTLLERVKVVFRTFCWHEDLIESWFFFLSFFLSLSRQSDYRSKDTLNCPYCHFLLFF